MQDLIIERLGHQGDGIAAGSIFVPGALPGEAVTWDGVRARIVTPSAERVRPLCAHAKTCGGCVIQHASDAFVAGWKRSVVENALSPRGLNLQVRNMNISPPRSRRRATFSARRSKNGVEIGFHAARSDTVIPVPHCEVVSPALHAALSRLHPLVRAVAARKGEVKLVVTETETGLDVDIRGGKPVPAESVSDLLFEGLARLSQEGEPLATLEVPRVVFDGVMVPLPPGAFLQATLAGEAALLEGVKEGVGSSRRILDLFAGCGTFSLPLARHADVHAVEAVPEMLGALCSAARATPDLHQLHTEIRDLFRRPLLAEEFKGFEAVVIDPPRAGAEAQISALARSDVPRIVMVSCNPVTFARDAAQLTAAGYQCDFIDVVDQFRWSAHIEIVAGFRRV